MKEVLPKYNCESLKKMLSDEPVFVSIKERELSCAALRPSEEIVANWVFKKVVETRYDSALLKFAVLAKSVEVKIEPNETPPRIKRLLIKA